MRKRYGFLFRIMAMFAVSAGIPALAAENTNIYTTKVGDLEVSLLSEGQSEGKASILLDATPEALKKYAPNGVFPMAANAFMIRTSDKVFLVDTGYGRKLFDSLKSLGISPEQVDGVLLTHMHGDHIGGLLRDGKPSFPKAQLYIAQKEHDYWTSDAAMNAAPENKRAAFEGARKAAAAYEGRRHLFEPVEPGAAGSSAIPGVQPLAAYGHTPGHTMFLIESKGEKLLLWGDLTHAMAIQMPIPSVAVTYDIDPKQAVASRAKVLKFVTEHNIPVAGAHVAFPAMGRLTAATEGGYTFTPLNAK